MKQIYMTPKTSATGKAVSEVLTRCLAYSEAELEFRQKYHVKTVFCFIDQLCGAVCVELAEGANIHSWIPFGDYKFIPGKDKKLMNDWRSLQRLSVPASDIDFCIGGFTSFFHCGFEQTDDSYVFTVDSDWLYVIPEDLQLVTDNEYV